MYLKIFVVFSGLSLLMSLNACNSGSSVPGANTPSENKESEEPLTEIHQNLQLIWEEIFPRFYDYHYDKAVLKFFTSSNEVNCGEHSEAGSSFYCGHTKTIFIKKGEVSHNDKQNQIYLYSHLLGHHISYISGTTNIIESRLTDLNESEISDQLLRLELLADYLAGVGVYHLEDVPAPVMDPSWERAVQMEKFPEAHSLHNFGYSNPSRRLYWFRRGMQAGDLSLGDTFNIPADKL